MKDSAIRASKDNHVKGGFAKWHREMLEVREREALAEVDKS